MAFDEALAARIRKGLGRQKGIEEKKMFGGLGFLLNPDYDPRSPFNNDYYPNGPPADNPTYIGRD